GSAVALRRSSRRFGCSFGCPRVGPKSRKGPTHRGYGPSRVGSRPVVANALALLLEGEGYAIKIVLKRAVPRSLRTSC
ncbi:MAG: hypothetical protein M3Q49_17335, partial [Actinomycetota bacterium]|nr:hypothetical protein [Actinomycetota bacterium]